MLETITIEKLVHGGQGLGLLSDGRKAFVWNALPGEQVAARIIKNKKDYAEAIAEDIIKPSKYRVAAKEQNYLATSPWQILQFDAESKYKKQIVKEIFEREHIDLPQFELVSAGNHWHYRNKMEYSFWGDDDGLHLALYRRGSKAKQIVQGSKLAMLALDSAANSILHELQKLEIRAGDLKSIILRCNNNNETVTSLFTKLDGFQKINLPKNIKGLRVYYSNPKSPASVATKLLYEIGDCSLRDVVLGTDLKYDVDSFFQVNLPIFERAVAKIKNFVLGKQITDMYGGVGSIGLSVGGKNVTIVELDGATAAMAKENADRYNAQVVQASTEKALEYVSKDKILIVDPPRAGLHKDVITRIDKVQPSIVIYLSCNPATQARDMKLLANKYTIAFFESYNFFPHTPHIETLAILQRTT